VVFFLQWTNMPIIYTYLLGAQTTFLSFFFIWVRASFPRIRYDRLINLTWKTFLPFRLAALLIITPIAALSL
jgi:NADH-quinone oxidoreductase subunit H